MFEFGEENEEFATIILSEFDMESVLESQTGLLAKFEAYCRSRAQYEATDMFSQTWRQEGDTWRLLRELLAVRLDGSIKKSSTDDRLLFPTDALLASTMTSERLNEHIVVKTWLEQTAPPFQPVELRTGYLPHTHQHLRAVKTTATDAVVSELDPDAPLRQNKRLAMEDQRYEAEVLRTMFGYVRRGQMSLAHDLCLQCNQPWRAASLNGGLLRIDPFLDNLENDSSLAGNTNRMLWKATCYQLALNASETFERAIYALACGDVANALPVCSTWEDHVWLRYNALLESRIDQWLSNTRGLALSGHNLSLPLPHCDLSPDDVFESLLKSEDPQLCYEANEPFHIIQAHLILDKLDLMFEGLRSQLEALERNEEIAPILHLPHVLRFNAHLILFLRMVGVLGHSRDTDYILAKFIEMLQAANKGNLVPAYTEFLPADMQVETLSKYLETVDEEMAVRQEYVQLGAHYNLDMSSICRATVQNTFRRGSILDFLGPEVPSVFLCGVDDVVPDADAVQIRALEWLVFDDGQFEDFLDHANLLIRRLLIMGHVQSVKLLLDTFPIDPNAPHLPSAGNVGRLATLIRERVQYDLLIQCFCLHTQWTCLFYRDKPKTDKKPSHKTLDWSLKVKNSTLELVRRFELLLGGDIFGTLEEAEAELPDGFAPQRNLELSILRSVYLPELVMWLHQVLFQTREIIPRYCFYCFYSLAKVMSNFCG